MYLAQDTKLDRKVALKILPSEVAADRGRMSRFVQEAKAASALNHPNILTIYEIDQANSVQFIATEFIDGETLRQRMKSAPLKLGEMLAVSAQIAGALSAAHAAGITHRDIKPENVMLRRDGIAKVLDFGLAKLTELLLPDSVDTEAPTSFKTDPGTVVGTAVYMSPEQARGMAVDARTDIFSLGVVMYEMVAECLPFEGSTSGEVVASILSEKEPPPLARYSREVPAELERIVSRALRKEREQRYQSAKDLMLDLQSLKQQLEFEARSERSMPPESKGAMAATTAPEIVATGTRPPSHSTSRIGLVTDALMLHRRSVILVATVVLVLFAGALAYKLLFRNAPTTTPPEIQSLAVLPLDNLSGDPAQDYFADGMTEELIASLSKIGNLRVISRTSVRRYKSARKPLKDIARELNVDAVVEGSVLRSGDRVHITLQLIHGATDRHVWAQSYQRDLRDILALQNEVGSAIASEIKIKLTPQEQGLLSNSRPVNPNVLEAYLKGRAYFDQGRNEPGEKHSELLKWSIGYFKHAVNTDPTYAPAYSGLSQANQWLASSGSPELYPSAKDAATIALQIDDTLAEAHAALAFILQHSDWDLAGAEREYKRALELNPSYSDAHSGYSLVLSAVGRHDEAIRQGTQALELDPLTIPFKGNLGRLYINARQYDRAIEYLRRVRDLEPNTSVVRVVLGVAYVHRGLYEEGIAEIREGLGRRGSGAELLNLAWAYAMAGRKNEAIKILELFKRQTSGGSISKVQFAQVYTALGDKDHAFAWLEKAYEEHSDALGILKVDPAFDGLRTDLRFEDLLRRVGLPQ